MECFECDSQYQKIVIDYEFDSQYGKLEVPGVEVLVCDNCGDECIDGVNSAIIDRAWEKLRKASQATELTNITIPLD